MSPWLLVAAAALVGGTTAYTAARGGAWFLTLPRRTKLALAMLVPALLLAAGMARGDDAGAPAGRCQSDIFHLVGPITPDVVPHFTEWLKSARAPLVVIDSAGGLMEASLALVDAVAARKDVRCRVRRLAASGAFTVLQACAVREMEPSAWLMTHEPRAFVPGAMDRLQAATFLFQIERLAREWNDLSRRRLRLTAEQYDEKVKGKDWILGAGEARAVGAIDLVR